ncbi:MAG: GatB/YqeY domain-containing protein, partial [Alcanivorax sp.]|nr:GatB/YqeY domain-containing protein [Alcanivorax sp.]
DERIELGDDRVLIVLDKMLKQRRESTRQYLAADRKDLADQEEFEISVIETFLPTKLTDDEIDQLIISAIESSGAESMRDMGKVMNLIKPQIQGRADGAEVSKRIKSRLG